MRLGSDILADKIADEMLALGCDLSFLQENMDEFLQENAAFIEQNFDKEVLQERRKNCDAASFFAIETEQAQKEIEKTRALIEKEPDSRLQELKEQNPEIFQKEPYSTKKTIREVRQELAKTPSYIGNISDIITCVDQNKPVTTPQMQWVKFLLKSASSYEVLIKNIEEELEEIGDKSLEKYKFFRDLLLQMEKVDVSTSPKEAMIQALRSMELDPEVKKLKQDLESLSQDERLAELKQLVKENKSNVELFVKIKKFDFLNSLSKSSLQALRDALDLLPDNGDLQDLSVALRSYKSEKQDYRDHILYPMMRKYLKIEYVLLYLEEKGFLSQSLN